MYIAPQQPRVKLSCQATITAYITFVYKFKLVVFDYNLADYLCAR